jgi:antitoxin YefM
MEVLNYTTLRKNLKAILDSVVEDHETVIINRGNENAVLISLDEYNSWKETMYLLSTEANRRRLSNAIDRDKNNDYITSDLIEE